MATNSKYSAARLLQENPVITLEEWAQQVGGRNSHARAVEQAKYYAETGRVLRLTRGLYAVMPLGADVRKFVPDPSVTVAVKSASGNQVFIIGKVNRPGQYPMNRPLDVMQVLSLAGGGCPQGDQCTSAGGCQADEQA